jgi:hypothetical protein
MRWPARTYDEPFIMGAAYVFTALFLVLVGVAVLTNEVLPAVLGASFGYAGGILMGRLAEARERAGRGVSLS